MGILVVRASAREVAWYLGGWSIEGTWFRKVWSQKWPFRGLMGRGLLTKFSGQVRQ